MSKDNPQTVTIYGRLSYPCFSMTAAMARNKVSKYPAADDKVKPSFNLLVEDAQLDKLSKFIVDVFLPYCVQQGKDGEKRNAFTIHEAKQISDKINGKLWDQKVPFIPQKLVGESTLKLVPEAAASIAISGSAGRDIVLKAIVRKEDELMVPDPDILSYPMVLPLNETKHDMYAGAQVGATLNLYGYVSGFGPGVSASATTAVFKADGDSLTGGVDIDEDELFLD